jgi:hypothetical protein
VGRALPQRLMPAGEPHMNAATARPPEFDGDKWTLLEACQPVHRLARSTTRTNRPWRLHSGGRQSNRHAAASVDTVIQELVVTRASDPGASGKDVSDRRASEINAYITHPQRGDSCAQRKYLSLATPPTSARSMPGTTPRKPTSKSTRTEPLPTGVARIAQEI